MQTSMAQRHFDVIAHRAELSGYTGVKDDFTWSGVSSTTIPNLGRTSLQALKINFNSLKTLCRAVTSWPVTDTVKLLFGPMRLLWKEFL